MSKLVLGFFGQVPIVTDLPAVGLDTEPSEDDIRKYARATGVPPKWVGQRRPQMRSYCGIPVESNGEKWGAIVIDSADAQGVTQTKERTYKKVATVVGKIIAGAGK